MSARFAIAAAALILAGVAPARSAPPPVETDHVFGEDPGWTQFRQIAEAAVIARLIDPDSARINWITGYHRGGFKPMLSKRIFGYAACGSVNARNRMGGYTGATTFIVVVDFGRALFVDLDSRPGGMYGEMCRQQLAAGAFPLPPQSDEQVAGGSAPPVASHPSPSGVSIRPMPEGAYVTAVEPKSIAAAAGLSAGMVITSVNGISLAGMGEAMTKVIAAAGSGATVTLVGGKALTLADTVGKAPIKP